MAGSNTTRGLVKEGNLPLYNRPKVKNADGSISTVKTISYSRNDGKEVLIPTISNEGKTMSPKEAIKYWGEKGQNLGVFSSPEDATNYAIKLHNDQASRYVNKAAGDLTDEQIKALAEQFQTGQAKKPGFEYPLGELTPQDFSKTRAKNQKDTMLVPLNTSDLLNTPEYTDRQFTGQPKDTSVDPNDPYLQEPRRRNVSRGGTVVNKTNTQQLSGNDFSTEITQSGFDPDIFPLAPIEDVRGMTPEQKQAATSAHEIATAMFFNTQLNKPVNYLTDPFNMVPTDQQIEDATAHVKKVQEYQPQPGMLPISKETTSNPKGKGDRLDAMDFGRKDIGDGTFAFESRKKQMDNIAIEKAQNSIKNPVNPFDVNNEEDVN